MYKPRYLSLSEALYAVAEYLTKTDPGSYRDLDAAVDAACKQLVQALSDGAVRSEGVFWEPMPPDPYALEPGLPECRKSIDNRFWSHQNCKPEVHSNEFGRYSELDIVTLYWDHSSTNFADEFETPNSYWDIRVYRVDIEREFLATQAQGEQLPVRGLERPMPDKEINRTGVAGRPTSKHLVARQMGLRAAKSLLSDSLAAEARALFKWLETAHPSAPAMTVKTIENAIRHDYRRLKQAQASQLAGPVSHIATT
jgi:hypothetical protein